MTSANAIGPLRYDSETIIRDGACGIVGLALLSWIAAHIVNKNDIFTTPVSFGVICVTVCMLACCYLLCVAGYRSIVRVTITPETISINRPITKTIRWSALETMSLRYFSTRRDGTNGWHRLTIGAGGHNIKLTSDLDKFEHIVVQAFRSTQNAGIQLDMPTRTNLMAFGLIHRDHEALAT